MYVLDILFLQDEGYFGVEWDGPLPCDDDDYDCSVVVIEPPVSPLIHQDYVELTTVINPMDVVQDYGIQLFRDCLDFVLTKLSSY